MFTSTLNVGSKFFTTNRLVFVRRLQESGVSNLPDYLLKACKEGSRRLLFSDQIPFKKLEEERLAEEKKEEASQSRSSLCDVVAG